MNIEEKGYAYWLYSIPGIGRRTIQNLLDACGGEIRKIYESRKEGFDHLLEPKQRESFAFAPSVDKSMEEFRLLEDKGIHMVVLGEEAYPEKLTCIPDPPFAIFYCGELPEKEPISVAIIGARDCSQYGAYVAEEIGKYLGGRGVSVISGLARGVDGISQAAAINCGGKSFGVLGCGVDICYPAQNRAIYEQLKKKGGVLSEYLPGTPVKAQNFPPRNRIVSGLADAVVVVEARKKSGTLITVDMALEQGKDVFVVPGRITDRLSDGCNRLLAQGAEVVLSCEQLYEELTKRRRNFLRKDVLKPQSKSSSPIRNLEPDLEKLYQGLDYSIQSVDEIGAKIAGVTELNYLLTGLMQLCLLDLAIQPAPGYFARKI